MIKLKIAGITFQIIYDEINIFDEFINIFSTYNESNIDIEVNIKCSEIIHKSKAKIQVYQESEWLHTFTDKNRFFANIYNKDTDDIKSMIKINHDCDSASIYYLRNNLNINRNFSGLLLEVLFRNSLILHNGLVIHSSAITWESKGIMFSAPSGTGKSTQANLWKKHMGARILNGDRPAIRVLEGQPFVYGTPWSGSSPDFSNDYAPLSAIFVLEQSPENSIKQLSSHEAICQLMPRCFFPFHYSELMDTAIDNFEKLIKTTPVFLLKCTPDKRAVDLAYRCIN